MPPCGRAWPAGAVAGSDLLRKLKLAGLNDQPRTGHRLRLHVGVALLPRNGDGLCRSRIRSHRIEVTGPTSARPR